MVGGRLSVSGILSAAIGLAGSGCAADRDDSALVEFERTGALGFCIDSGDVLNGRLEGSAIARAASSTFSGTVHLGWDDCPGYCELTEPTGPTMLTPAEHTELEGLLARLPHVPCELPVHPACDPCLIQEVTVDGVSHYANPCTMGCEKSNRAVAAIGEFFDSLVR